MADQDFTLLDHAPLGAIALNAAGVITYVNQMARDIADDWQIGATLHHTFDPSADSWAVGERQVHVSPLALSSGQGQLLFLSDLTDITQLEAQYRQSQKMQAVGQLAGGIAHDFNNLLTAIQGYTELLLDRHGPGDDAFADLLQIKQNTTRATNLVRQLLAFSRQQSLRPKALDVGPVIGDLVLMLSRLLGELVSLDTDLPDSLPPITVDQGQLEQVIINLAVNGRDAMPDGGQLSISAAPVTLAKSFAHRLGQVPPGSYVRISVADTGQGIPAEILDKVFDPFFTTKPQGKGTGLGLATVYGIIDQSGGYILCDSQVGRGTCFALYFPIADALPEHGEVPPVADAPPTIAAPAKTGPARILLVEDEAAVRTLALKALEKDGHDVTVAEDGEEALDLMRQGAGPFDLLVTDVVMPGLDGPGLWRAIEEEFGPMTAIFMSGYAEEELRKALGTDGGQVTDTHFLAKPFSLKSLMRMVGQVLAGG